MANIATLLDKHKAVSHTPLPYLEELRASGSPGPRTIIVTCADPRCVPETFFNLDPTSAVAVHRNAGGNIRDALRDINLLDTLFGLEEIAIIHHTDCGTLHVTDDQIRTNLKSYVPKEHWPEIEKKDFGANTDMHKSVKGDLEWVRASQHISDKLKNGTQGFVFDIKTGELEKVGHA